MDEPPFPILPDDLRDTLALAVAPLVKPAARAMMEAARLVFTYQGHDGRGSGTDEWGMRVLVPPSVLGTIEDLDALKTAITETVHRHVPQRDEITEVIVLRSATPTTKQVKGLGGLVEILSDDGSHGSIEWEGTLVEKDLEPFAQMARVEAVEDLRHFLQTFPDAAADIRQPRKSKPGTGLAPREAYPLGDEYDVQDLLWVALRMRYPKATREEPTPRSAGSSGRIDFVVAEPVAGVPSIPSIGVEVKLIRDGASILKVKESLLARLYDAGHRSDVADLMMFILETRAGAGQALDVLEGRQDGHATAHVVRVRI